MRAHIEGKAQQFRTFAAPAVTRQQSALKEPVAEPFTARQMRVDWRFVKRASETQCPPDMARQAMEPCPLGQPIAKRRRIIPPDEAINVPEVPQATGQITIGEEMRGRVN